MKPFLFTIALLLTVAVTATAQTAEPDHNIAHGSEIIVGHGFLPIGQLTPNSSDRNYPGYNYINDKCMGALFATYRYHLSQVISLGITMAYENEQGTTDSRGNYVFMLFGPPANNKTRFNRSCYTIAPEITFNYCSLGNGILSLYSTVGMGYSYRTEKIKDWRGEYDSNTKPLRFNAYASPLGIRFGKRLSGFCELGFGYKGVLNYGASYRF